MNTPKWFKPGLYGAAVGAVALAVVGFSAGGWMTASKASEMASNRAHLEVVAALVPICLEQSKHDPDVTETLAQLKSADSYRRGDMLMKAGWATMPGSDGPNSYVARACAAKLSAQF